MVTGFPHHAVILRNRAQPLTLPPPPFAGSGDQTRVLRVLRLDDDGPGSLTGLTTGGDLTRQAVTKHLAGLVRSPPLGRAGAQHASGLWKVFGIWNASG